MKTQTLSILMAGLMALAFSSCEKINGKGGTVSETRYATGYTGISLALSATVYYNQDSVYSLEISGQQNVIDRIITQVEGNQLVIKLKNGVHLGAHDPVSVFISAPDVRSLDISGSGDTYVQASSLLDVTISGSGNVWYLGTPVINTHISGSGNIRRL